MEQLNVNINKNLTNNRKKKSLALVSFSMGLISFLISTNLELAIFDLEFFGFFIIFFIIPFPILAIIYGIIALTEKENKLLSLFGILFGITVLFLFLYDPTPKECRGAPQARVMSAMAVLRSSAEIYYSLEENHSYSGFDEYIKKLGGPEMPKKCIQAGSFEINISPDGKKYCAKVNIIIPYFSWVCVDSTLDFQESDFTLCSDDYYSCQ